MSSLKPRKWLEEKGGSGRLGTTVASHLMREVTLKDFAR